MNPTRYAKLIKTELGMELRKHGSSLENFEKALAEINTGEGVFKIASDGGNILGSYLSKGVDVAGSIPELAFKGSLTGGALAGLTLDEADKSVDELNKSLEREREKVNMVRRITANLKREHGIQ
jgi:hypothetical protein